MTSSTNDLEEIDILPRWSYLDDEWEELIKSIVKIEDGKYYTEKEESEIDNLIKSLDL